MSQLKLPGAGVAILPAAITVQQQRELLLDALRNMPTIKAGGVTLGNKPPPAAAWSFEAETAGEQPRPACLACADRLMQSLGNHHRLGALFAADSRESATSLHLLPLVRQHVFHNVWARLYTEQNALGWHRDPYTGIRGWVCILNLGADATLVWRHGGQGARVQRARLASGDAILFNGAILEHAIEQVHAAETCPPFWREVMGSECAHVRVGLQMRA